jgi:spore maturation protein B
MVGIVRGSGMLDLVVSALSRSPRRWGVPAELLPVMLLRPLSGSGAPRAHRGDPEDPRPRIAPWIDASTSRESTETTFYVLAVYCGAVGVKRTRHALLACLLADAVAWRRAVLPCGLLLL